MYVIKTYNTNRYFYELDVNFYLIWTPKMEQVFNTYDSALERYEYYNLKRYEQIKVISLEQAEIEEVMTL